jgi:hypothetical protein
MGVPNENGAAPERGSIGISWNNRTSKDILPRSADDARIDPEVDAF